MVSDAHVGDVPDDCHPQIRAFFEYWKRIHPATGLPGRQHFDPVDIPWLLPNIFMVDAPSDAIGFTFRLMGTRLVEFFGEDFTGQPFINAYVKAEESRAFKDLCDLFNDRLPRWRLGLASFVRNREHTIVERLYVPLAADSEHVDIALGLMLAQIGGEEFR